MQIILFLERQMWPWKKDTRNEWNEFCTSTLNQSHEMKPLSLITRSQMFLKKMHLWYLYEWNKLRTCTIVIAVFSNFFCVDWFVAIHDKMQ
jgi:hypothetical protein